MARKKIIFVMVEGPSDSDALDVILTRWFDKETVYVHIMHCDITTEKGVSPSNILSHVTAEIKKYARDNHFVADHFAKIIHVVDTDGAFVPDEFVIEDPSINKVQYSEDSIQCSSKAAIVERNAVKAQNLNKLNTCAKMWNSIPYQVYYMSCNLDHVLYNKLNSTDEQKRHDSLTFARKYKDDLQEFRCFISESDFSVSDDYIASWQFIKEGKNSLERHSNLGLCFEHNDA